MNVFRFVLKTAPILLLVMPSQAPARVTLVLSNQEMLAKSDLVVIANPTSKTADTSEESFLPGLWMQETGGKQSRIKSIGVETVFAVSAVLKGDLTLRQFTLHHYREAQVSLHADGPYLVRFDPSDISKRSSYLLFLIREPDGRFASYGRSDGPRHESNQSNSFRVTLAPPAFSGARVAV